jgi:hypothetical protein
MPKDISELPCCLGEQGNVLAELCQPDQEDLLHQLAGGPLLRTMVSGMMVGRLMVQCARYPRVSQLHHRFHVTPAPLPITVGIPYCLLPAAQLFSMALCAAAADRGLDVSTA